MNILIAPDSFKDCMSAREVASALGRGIQKILPEADLQLVPMADGGEGTVESVIDATGGKRIEVPVMDPLMREISSFYGITGDGRTAVIEIAIYVVSGAVLGFLIGLTGVGGGVLAVPMLMLVVRLEPITAVGNSMSTLIRGTELGSRIA